MMVTIEGYLAPKVLHASTKFEYGTIRYMCHGYFRVGGCAGLPRLADGMERALKVKLEIGVWRECSKPSLK